MSSFLNQLSGHAFDLDSRHILRAHILVIRLLDYIFGLHHCQEPAVARVRVRFYAPPPMTANVKAGIPTHGSDCVTTHGIPPTAVGGLFRASLHRSTRGDSRFCSFSPRGARGERGSKNANTRPVRCRLCLKHPPTAVGGFSSSVASSNLGGQSKSLALWISRNRFQFFRI